MQICLTELLRGSKMGLKAIAFSAVLGIALAVYGVIRGNSPFASGLFGFFVFLFGSFVLPKLSA